MLDAQRNEAMMGVVFGGLALIGVGFFWLRGGWTLPLLLTLAYCGIGGLLAIEDAPRSFAVVLLFIWAPFVVRRLMRRRSAVVQPSPWQTTVGVQVRR